MDIDVDSEVSKNLSIELAVRHGSLHAVLKWNRQEISSDFIDLALLSSED